MAASRHTHTSCNVVPLVWGSLRLAPMTYENDPCWGGFESIRLSTSTLTPSTPHSSTSTSPPYFGQPLHISHIITLTPPHLSTSPTSSPLHPPPLHSCSQVTLQTQLTSLLVSLLVAMASDVTSASPTRLSTINQAPWVSALQCSSAQLDPITTGLDVSG